MNEHMQHVSMAGSCTFDTKPKCPACDRVLDAATGLEVHQTKQSATFANELQKDGYDNNAREPKEGDMSICFGCGSLLVFTDNNGKLRLMSQDDLDLLEKEDPIYTKIMYEVQDEIIYFKKHHKLKSK